MVETPKHVRGVDLVLNAFGYWPSFHDARIEGVRLDMSGAGIVMFKLRAFEMTSETDARGYFRLTKHHDVRFRFDDVADISISERDDTLFRLEIANEFSSGNGANGRSGRSKTEHDGALDSSIGVSGVAKECRMHSLATK